MENLLREFNEKIIIPVSRLPNNFDEGVSSGIESLYQKIKTLEVDENALYTIETLLIEVKLLSKEINKKFKEKIRIIIDTVLEFINTGESFDVFQKYLNSIKIFFPYINEFGYKSKENILEHVCGKRSRILQKLPHNDRNLEYLMNIVKILVDEFGVNINFRNIKNVPILFMAIHSWDLELFHFLMDRNVLIRGPFGYIYDVILERKQTKNPVLKKINEDMMLRVINSDEIVNREFIIFRNEFNHLIPRIQESKTKRAIEKSDEAKLILNNSIQDNYSNEYKKRIIMLIAPFVVFNVFDENQNEFFKMFQYIKSFVIIVKRKHSNYFIINNIFNFFGPFKFLKIEDLMDIFWCHL